MNVLSRRTLEKRLHPLDLEEDVGNNKGRKIQIVTGIENVNGVDFVTRDGARSGFVESAKVDSIDLKNITLEDLKSNRPDIVQDVESSVVEEVKKDDRIGTLIAENKTLKDTIYAIESLIKKERLSK